MDRFDRYDGNPGKENVIANVRQGRMEAEHSSKNQFVKKVQAEQAVNQGQPPNLKAEAMHFNAYMCNDGMHASQFAVKLTSGLDKRAFPVREAPKVE